MSVYAGPEISTSGLVLSLDAGNPKSYRGSGTTWFDLSGRSNHGTLINGPTYSSSNGGSIVFDGTNDYITVPSTNGLYLAGTSQVTVSCWARTNNASIENQNLVMWEDIESQNNLEPIRLTLTGNAVTNSALNPRFDLVNDSATAQFAIGTTITSSSIYYNLVGTCDGSSVKIFVNGKLDVQAAFSGNFRTPVSTTVARWIIGRGEVSNTDRLLNGNIAQVSIYNRALSAQEVSQNFNAFRGRFGI